MFIALNEDKVLIGKGQGKEKYKSGIKLTDPELYIPDTSRVEVLEAEVPADAEIGRIRYVGGEWIPSYSDDQINLAQEIIQDHAVVIPHSVAAKYPTALRQWAVGEDYYKGEVIGHAGSAYYLLNDITALEHQAPDAAGMGTIYSKIDYQHAGTLEDPFIFDPTAHTVAITTGQFWRLEDSEDVYKVVGNYDNWPCPGIYYPGSPGTSTIWEKAS